MNIKSCGTCELCVAYEKKGYITLDDIMNIRDLGGICYTWFDAVAKGVTALGTGHIYITPEICTCDFEPFLFQNQSKTNEAN